MPLAVGDRAPDFSLLQKIGQPPVRLSEALASGPVVLVIFPLAFSGVCTTEICSLADDFSSWEGLGATILGVSVDSPFVNNRFAAECKAPFPILSDFNREVVTAYGVRNDDFFGMQGVGDRSVFVINPDGTIRWAWHTPDASVLPDFDAVKAALRTES
jgi:glutaredoxin-dependent peroxiredoxin